MTSLLRGSCHCGRNRYTVYIPIDASDAARIIFDSNENHRISSASPLSVFLRVPLTWYHSEVFPFIPGEVRSTIRRTYAHPNEQHAQRIFCGFCGTPISYWTEQPRTEAEYIQVTVGSLLTQDLHRLEELGLLPDDTENNMLEVVAPTTVPEPRPHVLIGREFTSIPWFESLISGSRLGNMHTSRTVRHRQDGNVRVEYEVTEWTAEDNGNAAGGKVEGEEYESESSSTSTKGKRKRGLDAEHDSIQMSASSAA